VQDSDALRAAYNACLPKLSAYYSELGQHQGAYIAPISKSPMGQIIQPNLIAAQRKVIDNALRDFRCPGLPCHLISKPAIRRSCRNCHN
jgi:oligopeptidase A